MGGGLRRSSARRLCFRHMGQAAEATFLLPGSPRHSAFLLLASGFPFRLRKPPRHDIALLRRSASAESPQTRGYGGKPGQTVPARRDVSYRNFFAATRFV